MAASDKDVLQSILVQLNDLSAKVDALAGQGTTLSSPPTSPQQRPQPSTSLSASLGGVAPLSALPARRESSSLQHAGSPPSVDGMSASRASFLDWARSQSNTPSQEPLDPTATTVPAADPAPPSPYPQRIILTTYPGQVGVTPLPLKWGATDPMERGPVVASRHPSSIKIRNAIGAHNGSYSVYKALATAMGQLPATHRPNFKNTEPSWEIPYHPNWSNDAIVALDPWGHVTPQLFRESHYDQGVDIRPSIAVTRAHLKVLEIDEAVRAGRIPVDGKIVLKSPLPNLVSATSSSAAAEQQDYGVEVNVSKAAVEPVWYLPGVAKRFGIEEGLLRRALFEDGGGQYPELLTRPDLKVFLPPIGGLTVYVFGPTEYLSDTSKELTLRIHDECNGSDVFGSDICTCRPYLLYGIEEAIRGAQNGGVGVVVYFRKEGRALGEVTKYLVYNARKRGHDSAAMYFQRTEDIAGVKDMRFQALMPDVLLWLGIKKIDHLISMSDMKYNAIVGSGIEVKERHEIPAELVPADGQVEIDAKIAAGYFSGTRKVGAADLDNTRGRGWEDVDH